MAIVEKRKGRRERRWRSWRENLRSFVTNCWILARNTRADVLIIYIGDAFKVKRSRLMDGIKKGLVVAGGLMRNCGSGAARKFRYVRIDVE